MPDYKEGKIHKITCNVTRLTYYGSTVNSLSRRMVQHWSDFKKNRGNSCNSKLVLAAGNYDYCLVEKFPCDDKSELHRRERFYIETNDCCNRQVPGRTRKEYRDVPVHKERRSEYRHEHKEKLLKQMKEYRAENKEENAAKAAVKITCECGCKIAKGHIASHKKTQKHITLMSKIEQSV